MKILSETLRWGRFLMLLGVVSATVASCNLDNPGDEIPETPSDPSSNPPTPTLEGGYGTLSAVKSQTIYDPGVPGFPATPIDLGLAVGVFFNGTDYSTFINGGTVSCEDEQLTEQENGSYVFIPSQTNYKGIEFDGDPSWVVSGSPGVPAIDHTTSVGFPTVGEINSDETVSKGADYVLTVNGVQGADSVIFMLGGVVHYEPGNATSSTFTSAEIDSMGTGPSFAQAAAYIVEEQIFESKNFWFVNETVVTQSVTIE